MQIRGHVRTVKTGNPVPDGTEVEIRRHIDSSLIATVVTTGGIYEYFMNGSPGPYYVRVAIEDEVHISSSQVVGMSGPLDVGGLPLYFRLWNDGYISDVLEESSVFASGSGMQVTVRSGAHLVRGVLYDQQGHVNLAVDAADSQPRIDTVVIETMQPGSGRDVEGRTRLVVKKGAPAATPTAPSLTQTTGGIWEHPIANVRIDPAVSSVASNKVTDRRIPSNVKITDGYISTAMLADDAVTNAKLANSAVGTENIQNKVVTRSKIADKDITHHQILNGTIIESLIGAQAVTTGKIASSAVTPAKLSQSYALASHSHSWSQITSKPSTFTPSSHSHSWSQITSKPSTFTPSSHTHSGSQITSGSIAEDRLATSVRNKLNAYGYAKSSGGVGFWVNFSSTSWTNIKSQSISIPSSGTWILLCIWNGRIGSQSDNYGSYQTRIMVGSTQADSSLQNWETNSLQGTGAGTTSFITLSGSGSRTVYLQARRSSGVNGKVEGVIRLLAFKVG